MTNKYNYFVANWKMFGNIKSINSTNKVIKISKLRKFRKAKIIYCPPYTLISDFVKKLRKTKIEVGAQNCHHSNLFGPFTGCINAKMIKNLGCNYVIIGHSENRKSGDTDLIINKKIKSSLSSKLNIFFCIGETFKEKNEKRTKLILSKQIKKGLDKIKITKKIIIAYEPVWSIGTGLIPNKRELSENILFIKKLLKKNFNINHQRVLYGGSVTSKNVRELSQIKHIDGFLVGGASLNPNKFIDIIKKTFN
tara:strand:- start:332 stop:1084 length:753 start_codon:yes stop_codon:yes gene_type:complete